MDVANRYQAQDLFIDSTYHEKITDFVSRGDKDGKESKPFSRQVDVWWLALGLGVHMGHRTPLGEKRTKFNDAGILSSDPWRITHLELLALAEDDETVLESPATVIRIATEFANTGFPWLIEQLLGQAEPALTLMNRLGALDSIDPLGL